MSYYPCKKCKTKKYFCQLKCKKFYNARMRDAKKRLYDKYGDENSMNYKVYSWIVFIAGILMISYLIFSVLCIIFTVGKLLG